GTVYAGGVTVYKSTNDGATWSGAAGFEDAGFVYDIAIDPSDHHRIYAGTGYGGIYRSVDAGVHWTPINTPGFPLYRSVWSLAVDPADSQTLWAVSNDSLLHRSHDGGQSWVSVETPAQGSGIRIAFDPVNPQILCYGTSFGLVVSLDAGATWTLTPLSGTAVPMAFDPSSPSTIYASSGDE